MPTRRRRARLLIALAIALSACHPDAPQSSAKVDPLYERYADSIVVNIDGMTRKPSGVYVREVVFGHGPVAVSGSQVEVHYTGWLPNGTKFDSSRDRGQPLGGIQLGAGQVIPGWEDGIMGMRVGGRRVIVIPSDLAYGPRGIPNVIPPNSNLVFDVELVGVR